MANTIQTIDPPFISAKPATTEEVAKRIVRKTIKAKLKQPVARRSPTSGTAFFNKLEFKATGLYDHLEGPILKELNQIIASLQGASAGTGDAAKLATATDSAKEARVILSNLINKIGAVQSNIRHTYAGSRSGFANPALKK